MPNTINEIDLFRSVLNSRMKTAGQVKNEKDQKLEKTCKDFESLFVSYMMQQMRQTIPDDGLIGRSHAEKIYTGMLDNEVAKTISHTRGLGLAKAMYEQLSNIEEEND